MMQNDIMDDLTPTPSQTVGPFFHLGCTDLHSVGCIARKDTAGEHVRLVVCVLDGNGAPVDDAMIEIWQADSSGRYSHQEMQRGEALDLHWTGFGRLATDKDGTCIFETIKPGRVPADGGKFQAPHLNVSIFARGLLKQLATRIYFADERANEQCPVLALVPPERRATLLARRDSEDAGQWRFNIRLCGENETVFFDL